jgi:SAM-dependent methyltransferase
MRGFLRLPEAESIDIDSPAAILVHRSIILRKPFLRRLYQDWYAVFQKQARELGGVSGELLEIGSGGGFLKDVMPSVITSDVDKFPTVDRMMRADALGFDRGGLKGIFLLNVLHHIPEPQAFFKEAERCLARGGRVVMIEPFNSALSRWIYRTFHHEAFEQTVKSWDTPAGGRLSASNQAIPWIIFWRDRERFERLYPTLKIVEREAHTSILYLISGGLSMRALLPSFLYPVARALDRLLSRFPALFPMFQTVVLERQS